ncbi:MAG TPA: DUF547 domain-containing protein [Chitinophagaceae bacterium]|nr:DUF547 domain-containing protein [Chitinophagaceae bacterium]
MKQIIHQVIFILVILYHPNILFAQMDSFAGDYIKISQSLLYSLKTEANPETFLKDLKDAKEETLIKQLYNDDRKKAFWLNIYNSFVQLSLSENPSLFKKRSEFFSRKRFVIAGKPLSLDDIEHGILRRSKIKWSLGHLNKLFPGGFEKKFRVDTLDYRIHFALNCGAKSCPPIVFYDPEKIERQLRLATRSYLKSEVIFNESENIVELPAIMSWFRRDFGGKRKMIQLLRELEILPTSAKPSIRFKKYNWEVFLSHYKES